MLKKQKFSLEKITPKDIDKWANATFYWWAGGLIITLPLALFYGLFESPPDYQQGQTVRIMYLHVPAAYISSLAYMLLGGACIGSVIWKSPAAEIIARAIAPLGMIASLLALITGAIWGQPTWGTWWVWDARLTSVLLLFFLYIAFITAAAAFDDGAPSVARPAAIIAIAGLVNLPIIHYSVEWWNTLHQGASIMRFGGSTIDKSMGIALSFSLVAFTCFFAILFIWRINSICNKRKIKTILKQQTLDI